MARPSSRNRILQAALDIVRRDGFAGATVDAVTAEAAISRGGFLYHFPTKQALVFAMLDSEFEHLYQGIDEHARALPEGPGRRLKAYILLWLEETKRAQEGLINVMTLLHDPETRKYILNHRRRLIEHFLDPLVPDIVVRVAFLTCDGLWCMNMIADADEEERRTVPQCVADELFLLIDQGASDLAAARAAET